MYNLCIGFKLPFINTHRELLEYFTTRIYANKQTWCEAGICVQQLLDKEIEKTTQVSILELSVCFLISHWRSWEDVILSLLFIYWWIIEQSELLKNFV